MKKTLYLLLALACTPLCMPTEAVAAVQPSQVQQALPDYTGPELRYLLKGGAITLDIMADLTETMKNERNQGKIAVVTAIVINQAILELPTTELSSEAQEYLAAIADLQRNMQIQLKDLLVKVETGELDSHGTLLALNDFSIQNRREAAKLDAMHPQIATKLNADASAKAGLIVAAMLADEVQAEMAQYQASHPQASQTEIIAVGWRASAKIMRDLADAL